MLSTLQPRTSSSFKMVNLVLEQDPKSVNINPTKQEVEMVNEIDMTLLNNKEGCY